MGINYWGISIEEQVTALEYLIRLQDLEGLKFYIQWVKDRKEQGPLNSHYSGNLGMLRDKATIPYLMELLEISYANEIKIDRYESLRTIVLNVLNTIALVNEENFMEVTRSLREFMEINIKKYKDINYLLLTIEKIESQFYMNKAQTYNIYQVIDKIKMLN